MAGHSGPPALVSLINTYPAYFSFPETNPFSGNYQTVLESYLIDPMNAGAVQTPEIVSQQVYAARKQGDNTAFLLWHATLGIAEDCNPGRLLLLHSVSYCESWVGLTASRWDGKTLTNRGDVSYGTAPWAKCGIPPTSTFPQTFTCQALPRLTLTSPAIPQLTS